MKIQSAHALRIHPMMQSVFALVALLVALLAAFVLAAPAAAPALTVSPIVMGTMRDASNSFLPLQGVRVDVEFWNTVTLSWDVAGTAWSAADGTYAVPDTFLCGPGNYSIKVSPPLGAAYAGYPIQWFWGDAWNWNGSDPMILNVNMGQAPLIVSGRVTDAMGGGPIQNAEVIVYFDTGVESPWWATVGTVTTNANGEYEIRDTLDRGAGEYRIKVRTPFAPQYEPYVEQNLYRTWNGTDPLTVNVVLGPSVALATGAVHDAVTLDPIPGVNVMAYALVDSGSGPTWTWTGSATTDVDGSYTVKDLVGFGGGEYKFVFSAGDAPELGAYGTRTHFATWSGTGVLDVDATLQKVIATGTVTNAVSREPLADVAVTAEHWEEFTRLWTSVDETTTDANGDYSLEDLIGIGSGEYRITLEKPGFGREYRLRSWSGTQTLSVPVELKPLAADGYEPDNTQAEANSILANGTIQPHTLFAEGDLDFVAFQATAGTLYAIETHDTHGPCDTILTIFDSSGVKVAENDDIGATNRFSFVEWTAVANETAYARVSPYPGATGFYGVSVTVLNHSPVATNDAATCAAGASAVIPVLANDGDSDSDDLSAIKVSDPGNGSAVLNANGTFTYTPTPGWSGTDTFTYKANDGTADSNVALVTVTVTAAPPLNHAPVASNDNATCAEDGSVVVPVLANDSDADADGLSAIKVSNPAHGTATLNANGTFTFTPAVGWSGTDTFTYKANDGTADSNVALVTVTVTAAAPAEVQFIGSSSSTVLAKYGATYALSGTLMCGAAPVVDGRVVLQQSASAAGPFTSTTLTALTDASGRFTLPAVEPATKTWYRAYFEGVDRKYLPLASAGVCVTPRASVGNPVAPLRMSSSRSYSVYSNLKPRHTAGTTPLRIYKWRYVSGKWKSYGYAKAKAYNYSSYTRAKLNLRLASRGKWRLKAYHPADAGHAATWSSSYDYVTVR